MNLLSKIALICFLTFTMSLFQNCIETPVAPNSTALSSSGFNHQLVASIACQSCHEKNRPPNHHIGQDCKGCHVPGGSWLGSGSGAAPTEIVLESITDKNGNTLPATIIPHPRSANCNLCHGNIANIGTKKVFDYDHGATLSQNERISLRQQPYCVYCHYITNRSNPNVSRFRGRGLHSSFQNITVKDCVPCHSNKFGGFHIPNWSDTTGSGWGRWK